MKSHQIDAFEMPTQIPPVVEMSSDLIAAYERELQQSYLAPLPDDDDEDFEVVATPESIVYNSLKINIILILCR